MPFSRLVRRRRHSGGQSLVEFALVAPIFFLLLFSVIQLGLIMAAQNGLVDGVRSAARRAATYRINEASFNGQVFPSICAAIELELATRLGDRIVGYTPARVTSTITYEWVAAPENGEWFLVARVDASFANQIYLPIDPLLELMGLASTGAFPGSVTLSASEQMRVENPALEKVEAAMSHTCP